MTEFKMKTENNKFHFGSMKGPLAIFGEFKIRPFYYSVDSYLIADESSQKKIVCELLLLLINDERR